MTSRIRNLLIWIGVAALALGLWFFAARTRMHLVDELSFLGCVAVAALALTALYSWDVAASDSAASDGAEPQNPDKENK